MRFMVIVKATRESEAGVIDEKDMAAMGNFNEELANAGIMLAAEGLHPSSKGARVTFNGPKRTVIDGPFAETKELVGGYWIWQVASLAEAIAWVKRCPNPFSEGESRDRDPADLRNGGLRPRAHARAARAGGTPARAGRGAQVIVNVSGRRKPNAYRTVPVLRRPRRGGDRVLQEGAGRRGADAHALQGRPEQPPPDKVAPGSENKVMHASLKVGDTVLMLSDGMASGKTDFKGFSLSISVNKEADADRIFAALADGRPSADAARQDLLVAEVRHGRRQIRRGLDGEFGGVMEAGAVFGRRWFLALALRQVPAPEDPLPAELPADAATQCEETDECAS